MPSSVSIGTSGNTVVPQSHLDIRNPAWKLQDGTGILKKRNLKEVKATRKEIHGVIAENVREFRRMAHMTQEQLAERIGKEQGYISKIETCARDESVNCVDVLSDIADAFGVSVDALFRAKRDTSVHREADIIRGSSDGFIDACEDVKKFIYRDFGFLPDDPNNLSDEEKDSYRFSYEEFSALEITPLISMPSEDTGESGMNDNIYIVCASAPLLPYDEGLMETRFYAIWGGLIIGIVSGISFFLHILTDSEYEGELDSHDAVYSDLSLCLFDYLDEQTKDASRPDSLLFSEVDIFSDDDIWNNPDYWAVSVFLISDAYVHSAFRKEGVFTNLVKAMEVYFGNSFLSCMCLNGTVCDEEDESLPIDDTDYNNENIETNRRIAEKFGWHTTDFINDATDYGIVFAVRADSDVTGSLRNAMTAEKPSEDAGPLTPG